ncbi:MAG: hypothetical protein V9G12_26155 [Microthrixaceae bacterium]
MNVAGNVLFSGRPSRRSWTSSAAASSSSPADACTEAERAADAADVGSRRPPGADGHDGLVGATLHHPQRGELVRERLHRVDVRFVAPHRERVAGERLDVVEPAVDDRHHGSPHHGRPAEALRSPDDGIGLECVEFGLDLRRCSPRCSRSPSRPNRTCATNLGSWRAARTTRSAKATRRSVCSGRQCTIRLTPYAAIDSGVSAPTALGLVHRQPRGRLALLGIGGPQREPTEHLHPQQHVGFAEIGHRVEPVEPAEGLGEQLAPGGLGHPLRTTAKAAGGAECGASEQQRVGGVAGGLGRIEERLVGLVAVAAVDAGSPDHQQQGTAFRSRRRELEGPHGAAARGFVLERSDRGLGGLERVLNRGSRWPTARPRRSGRPVRARDRPTRWTRARAPHGDGAPSGEVV